MATQQNDVEVRVAQIVEGLGQSDKLAKEIEGLGDAGQEASAKAKTLQSELAGLGQQNAAISELDRTAKAATEARDAMALLDAEISEVQQQEALLNRNQQATAQGLDLARGSTAALRSELVRLQTELKLSKDNLAAASQASREAGNADETLKLNVVAAREQVQQLNAAVRQKVSDFREASSTENSLDKALQKDQLSAQRTAEQLAALGQRSDELKAKVPFAEYRRLARFAGESQGTVIISVNDHPAMRDVFSALPMQAVEIDYTVGGTDRRASRSELVIGNWKGGWPQARSLTQTIGLEL